MIPHVRSLLALGLIVVSSSTTAAVAAPFVANASLFARTASGGGIEVCGKGQAEGTASGTWTLRVVTVRTDGTHTHDTNVHLGTTLAQTCLRVPTNGSIGYFTATLDFVTALTVADARVPRTQTSRDVFGGCLHVGLLLPHAQSLTGACPEAYLTTDE